MVAAMPYLERRIEELEKWLVAGPIQLQADGHYGGIAGWLDNAGIPAFAYGESTGYYLTCGAFALAAGSGFSKQWHERMLRAEQWLHALWSKPPPPTRHYVTAIQDWRNEATFTFDCSIMLRGLGDRVGAQARNTRLAIMHQLTQHVADDGSFVSQLPLGTRKADLPRRWSTMAGPFLLKAAAATLSVGDLTPDVVVAAERTATKWCDWYKQHQPAGDLHPLLYYLEGLFLLNVPISKTEGSGTLLSVYLHVLSLQRDDGSLPQNFEDRESPARADVLAQALRLGCLMIGSGLLERRLWAQHLDRLAASLETFIDESGGVRFQHVADATPQINVWCSIFAYQALVLYDRVRRNASMDELVRLIA